MQREWKTWPQIAVMIMRQIRNFPCGDSLHWLEFREIDDEASVGSFIMDTGEASAVEVDMIANYVTKIFERLRYEYKISSKTIH